MGFAGKQYVYVSLMSRKELSLWEEISSEVTDLLKHHLQNSI